MVQLSARAQRELAIMHAADAVRVFAAAVIPLHLLPLCGMMFALVSFHYSWLGFFLTWSVAQVVLHLTLLSAADSLLEETRRNMLLAITASVLLIALTAAGQMIVAGLLGVGVFLIILILCGLFDMLAIGALLYVFWATYRAAFGRYEIPADRHIGFEVVMNRPLTVQSAERVD